MTDQAMYCAANRAIRAYTGPLRQPNGARHPDWVDLLAKAERLRLRAQERYDPIRRCPTCDQPL